MFLDATYEGDLFAAAGVAFQELRRWRVRERDIFRLGSGTALSLLLLLDYF